MAPPGSARPESTRLKRRLTKNFSSCCRDALAASSSRISSRRFQKQAIALGPRVAFCGPFFISRTLAGAKFTGYSCDGAAEVLLPDISQTPPVKDSSAGAGGRRIGRGLCTPTFSSIWRGGRGRPITAMQRNRLMKPSARKTMRSCSTLLSHPFPKPTRRIFNP